MPRDRTVTLPTEHYHRKLPPSPTGQAQEGSSEIAGTGYIPGGVQLCTRINHSWLHGAHPAEHRQL